jgi:hypothetical protein
LHLRNGHHQQEIDEIFCSCDFITTTSLLHVTGLWFYYSPLVCSTWAFAYIGRTPLYLYNNRPRLYSHPVISDRGGTRVSSSAVNGRRGASFLSFFLLLYMSWGTITSASPGHEHHSSSSRCSSFHPPASPPPSFIYIYSIPN